MTKRIARHALWPLSRRGLRFALLVSLPVLSSVGASAFGPLNDEAKKVRTFDSYDPGNVSIRPVPSLIALDWREPRRWRIGEKMLPPGGLIQFERPSFWQLCWSYIIPGLAVIVIQLLLVARLLIDRARRRRAEAERANSLLLADDRRRALDNIVSNIPGVVWEVRLEPGSGAMKVQFVSRYAEKMLGYGVDEWLSDPGFLQSIVCGEDREEFVRQRDRILTSGRENVVQFRCMAKDGRTLWTETHMTPVVNGDGSAVGLRAVTLDITDRKQVEAQLSESETRFRNLANAAPLAVWVTGPDKLCTFVNKSWLDLTGRSLEDELGTGWAENIYPDDYDRCLQTYFSAFDRREPFAMEWRLRCGNGKLRWIYDSGVPNLSSSGEFLGYIGFCVDVTDSKLAQEAVRESQTRLAGIIGSAMDAIITVDERGFIILFNAAAQKVFACSAEEAIGQSVERFIPEQLREVHRQHVRRFEEANIQQRLMGAQRGACGRRANGEEFPIEASISQTELNGHKLFTVILRDITARKKAEQALKESEADYRTIFNGVNDAIFIHDKESGDIVEVNEKMCDMYGVTPEEARKLRPTDLSANEPPYTEEAALNWIKKAAAGVPQLFEWRARDKAGRVFWVEVSLRCIALSGKERVMAVVHDITDRKRAEQALAEEFSQVEELTRILELENISLKKEISAELIPNEILGESEAIRSILFKVEQVARTNTTVLILGETGTGKDLVARAVHGFSLRNDKPLINVNCSTLQPTLIESELFGHERGAFTGATARRLGRFELANGGTIFLDEIGDLPLELQAKLLRVLQEGEFQRLGSGKTIKVNVRVIAATNRNLPLEVQKGLFREDLWYRLNVFPITVPPLRERKEDIPLLVEKFTGRFAMELGKTITVIPATTIKALQDYDWPGNVRELANVIERATINTTGTVLRLAEPIVGSHATELPFARQTLEHVERQYILRVLEETQWRIEGPKGAARVLGLNPSTLRTRMAKLGLKREELV